MKIHEYQAKQIFASFGIPIQPGIPVFSVQEALDAAKQLGQGPWVVKAQIHAGGRGKAGGVKIAKTMEEVKLHSEKMLSSMLVTKQTGPLGKKVERLYIEKAASIAAEFYVAILVDRVSQTICLMASASGGMDIEEVAQRKPQAILKLFIDPAYGLTSEAAHALAKQLGFVHEQYISEVSTILTRLYETFVKTDASLIEVNPLAVLEDGSVVALDAKIVFDENALFRHPEYQALRDESEEDPLEAQARSAGLSYIALDGSIACMVNGAGLAMATMDTIKLYGEEPANFLDVGGGASAEKVTAAFQIMLANPNVKAILINIFGGIMHCDTIAEGVVQACRSVSLKLPLVVRMNGTNEELGRRILAESGLKITPAKDMAEAAQKVVEACRAQR